MSFGKMNGFADIVREKHTKDKAGFDKIEDEVLASVRVYREGRHGSTRMGSLIWWVAALPTTGVWNWMVFKVPTT